MILDIQSHIFPQIYKIKPAQSTDFKIEAQIKRSGRIVKDNICFVDTENNYIMCHHPVSFRSEYWDCDDWDTRAFTPEECTIGYVCNYIKIFYYDWDNHKNGIDESKMWHELLVPGIENFQE